MDVSENELIKMYFDRGYTASEIRTSLQQVHSITLSIRHLRRRLAAQSLRRRPVSPLETVIAIIQVELEGSGRCLGYRAMWHKLRTHHKLKVNSNTVRCILKLVDPVGVAQRSRSRLVRRVYVNDGPNYCIHIDGYDKLKPYGFAIHGAIDGFSRKILWLRVGRSNNDPRVVAGYYVDYIKDINGVPRKIRVDAGTENVLIINMQKALRSDHIDDMSGSRSCLIGRSVHNQRIERWWGILRTSNAQYWMNLFGNMIEYSCFNREHYIQRECLRFSFMTLIQKELDIVRDQWNSHRIRESNMSSRPPGKPYMMYEMPEIYGRRSHKYNIPENTAQAFDDTFVTRENDSGVDNEYAALFSDIMQREHFYPPVNTDEALLLYAHLVDECS